MTPAQGVELHSELQRFFAEQYKASHAQVNVGWKPIIPWWTPTHNDIYIYIQKNLMANGCSSPNKRWPYSYYCNMYLINPRSCWGLPNAPLHLWYWRPGCFGERCVQKLRGSVTISVIAAGFQPSWTALGRAGERLQLCDFPGVGDGEGDNSGQLLSIPGAAQTCSRPTNSWWSYSLDELAAATPDAALPEILALRKHSVGTGTDWFLPIPGYLAMPQTS